MLCARSHYLKGSLYVVRSCRIGVYVRGPKSRMGAVESIVLSSANRPLVHWSGDLGDRCRMVHEQSNRLAAAELRN